MTFQSRKLDGWVATLLATVGSLSITLKWFLVFFRGIRLCTRVSHVHILDFHDLNSVWVKLQESNFILTFPPARLSANWSKPNKFSLWHWIESESVRSHQNFKCGSNDCNSCHEFVLVATKGEIRMTVILNVIIRIIMVIWWWWWWRWAEAVKIWLEAAPLPSSSSWKSSLSSSSYYDYDDDNVEAEAVKIWLAAAPPTLCLGRGWVRHCPMLFLKNITAMIMTIIMMVMMIMKMMMMMISSGGLAGHSQSGSRWLGLFYDGTMTWAWLGGLPSPFSHQHYDEDDEDDKVKEKVFF